MSIQTNATTSTVEADYRKLEAISSKVVSQNFAYNEKIDHLRFLAATIIIFHHTVCPFICLANQVTCFTWDSAKKIIGNCSGLSLAIESFSWEGHTAVALFMTLSGFLFARICQGKTLDYKGFLQNRLLRIYPLYLSAIFLALYVAPQDQTLLKLLGSVFCLQNVFGVEQSLITPALWTIAVEFQFYLIFPFLLSFQQQEGNKALWKIIAVAAVVRSLSFLLTGSINDLAYRSIFGRIDQFLIGMMLGLGFQTYREKLKSPIFLFLSIIVAIVSVISFHKFGGWEYSSHSPIWIVFPFIESCVWGFFIVSYCASSFNFSRRVSTILATLGTLSFSMYVTHFYFSRALSIWCYPRVERLWQSLTGTLPHGSELLWLAFFFSLFVVLPCTVALSWLTYNAIELPFLRMRIKYTKQAKAAD